MRILIDLFNPQNNSISNKTANKNSNNDLIKRLPKTNTKLNRYLKINLLIITIPIISYCSLYTWKYYKKTKKVIDDYLDSYLNRLKQRIKFFKEKMEAERIRNCNNNLNIELDLYNFIDLNTCLEIIHLKTEINHRLIYLQNYELYANKLQALHSEVFEEYFCYFNEIKKKNRINDWDVLRIIEENLNISYKKIEQKVNEEKEFLIELNEIIMTKDFYTREKYEYENKFSLYEFFNIDGILSFFSFFKKIKNIVNQNNKKNFNDLSLNNQNNTNIDISENINNIDKDFNNQIFDPKEILDISIESQRNKFTIPENQIGLYCSAFIDFSNIIIKKLEDILGRNDIDLTDQINISRDLKNFTKCLLSNAFEFIKEKYKLNIKNIFPVILLNECFKEERIIYCLDELKSYLTKFNICLLDF